MAGNVWQTRSESHCNRWESDNSGFHLQGEVNALEDGIVVLGLMLIGSVRGENMAKLLAITIMVIAVPSAIPIIRHYWEPPADISTHGHMIDDQFSETMLEAGV